jgi:hypothetical protein
MNQRVLASFTGPVDCRHSTGAVNLLLCGTERDSGLPIELLFSAANLTQPAQSLHDIDVLELIDERSHRFWQIRTRTVTFEVVARAVQVHRATAPTFLRAVPPPRIPLRVRLQWAALLWALRIPGMAGLAMRWRARP